MKNPFDKNYFENKINNKSIFHNFFIKYSHRHEPFFKILKKKKMGLKLLDAGCGSGAFLEHAQDFFDCTGIDISKEGLEIAKKKAPRVKFLKRSIYNLNKFEKESFDIVCFFDVLEHVVEILKILDSAYTILKPEGIMVLSVPNGDSFGIKTKWWKWYGFKDKTHIWLHNTNEWERILDNAGFVVVKKNYDGLTDPPYLPIIPKFVQALILKFPTQGLALLGFCLPRSLGETLSILCIKNPNFKSENYIFQKELESQK